MAWAPPALRFFLGLLGVLALGCSDSAGTSAGGQGGSVGCSLPTDCPGSDNLCGERTCTNGLCGRSPLAEQGFELPTQPVGDCATLVCDGAGDVVAIPDGGDSKSDGKPCTKDLCEDGMPAWQVEPEGTACGMGLTCDAEGACVGCVVAADCGTDDACFEWVCSAGTCTKDDAPNGAACGECAACAGGACVAIAQGADPFDDCAGADVCSGSLGLCGCSDGVLGGDETAVDCGGACGPCGLGSACTSASDCATGHCFDGVCCNVSCADACSSCTLALTGLPDGECGFTLAGLAGADDLCLPAAGCDGAGACALAPLGTACGGGSECASGFCTDGVCCDAACGGACFRCDFPGAAGQCKPFPADALDPEAACVCSGANGCL